MKQDIKAKPIFENEKSGPEDTLRDTLYYFGWTAQGTMQAFEQITQFIQEHARLIYKRADLVYLKIERAPVKASDES
jgi:hypothetical protein